MRRQFKIILACITLFACLMPSASLRAMEPDQIKPLVSEIEKIAVREYESLRKIYVQFHEFPELSFQEKESSKRLATELRSLGFEVTENIGGFGVVGLLKNGDGPVVLVRADMDALPVKEETGLPHASKVTTTDDAGETVPVMHACGHDIHMTNFVGTARALAALKDRWRGTLVFIAQPAEERGAGAKAMIADGLFTRFPRPDACLALHVDSGMPAGTIGYTPGYALANVDSVDILVRGAGGHGAYPETTKDPIVIAAHIVTALQTIVSREISAREAAVVTVGSIHGGTKHNIIPNEVLMQLTVRSYTDEVRAQLLKSIERISKGIAAGLGVPDSLAPIVTVKDEYTPATYNNPELAKRVTDSFRELMNGTTVVEREPMMGGEDFGRYGREEPRIPIFMYRLGAVAPSTLKSYAERGQIPPSLHSSKFAPDLEPTLMAGVESLTIAALSVLESR